MFAITGRMGGIQPFLESSINVEVCWNQGHQVSWQDSETNWDMK
jgi:hypothetical protein